MSDTIVALATPTGRSGIGVVRLSGEDALTIARRLLSDDGFAPEPRTAHLKELVELETGDVMDQAIITWFKAPHSFTGEDVVEISCHGSPVLLRQVIDACLAGNARLAHASLALGPAAGTSAPCYAGRPQHYPTGCHTRNLYGQTNRR